MKKTALQTSLLVALAVALPAAADSAAVPTLEERDPPIDWRKPVVRSGSLMLVGIAGLHALGETDNDPDFEIFKEAFQSGPKKDDDGIGYNLVLHPLWGSETYLRAREGHMGILGSIGFSMGASVFWEYFIESWTEHPSSQDLVYTTGIGWLLGELRYRLKLRTGPKAHRWIDPIDTFLKHVRFVPLRDGSGDLHPGIMYSIRF